MASPAIRSFAGTNGTAASATPVITLPAAISGGDTIFVVFRVAVAGAIGWPDATWTEMVDASPDGADDQMGIAWKKADGSEAGTTITLSCTSGKFGAMAWAISGAADPTARAPELSTVAIGTTGQPDATTVTPTGGSKDYLFLTFVTQEGEQTGITTYPTNYTLGQSGLVNSGTAAAATTNVTLEGAARQATASSEDAGVWSIAGTLSNWSAYTAAFHPAIVPDAPLVVERDWPQQWVPKLSLSSIECLPTVSAVVTVPFSQTVWPGTIGPRSPIRMGVWVRPPYLVDQYPVGAKEIQGARPPGPSLRIASVSMPPAPAAVAPQIPVGATAEQPPVRPAPRWGGIQTSRPLGLVEPFPVGASAQGAAARATTTSTPATLNLTTSTLSQVAQPFTQTSWPTPSAASQRGGFQWNRPAYLVDQYPVGQSAQDRNQPRAVGSFRFQANPPPQTAVTLPFTQTAWPNSVAPPALRIAITSVPPEPAAVAPQMPFTQTAWPQAPVGSGGTIVTISALPSIAAAVTTAPFVQTSWPIPRPAAPPGMTWLSVFTVEPAPADLPFTQTAWPLPKPSLGISIVDVSALPSIATVTSSDLPAGQRQFNPPAGPKPSGLGFYASYIQASGDLPFTPIAWPGARKAAPQTRSWAWSRPLGIVEQAPIGVSQQDRPAPAKRGPQATSIGRSPGLTEALPPGGSQQDRPAAAKRGPQAQDPSSRPPYLADQFPVGDNLLDGARRVSRTLANDSLNLLTTTLTTAQAPFTQTDWPTRRVASGGSGQTWSRPLGVIEQAPIGASTQNAPQKPIGPQPAIIATLLTTTLAPTGQAPFVQVDWPGTRTSRTPGVTQTWARPLGIVDAFPVGRALMGMPAFVAPAPGSFLFSYISEPAIVDVPFTTTYWPKPSPAAPAGETFLATVIVEPAPAGEALPFTQTQWPGTWTEKPIGLTHLWIRPQGLAETLPVGGSALATPKRLVAPPGFTHTWARPLGLLETLPIGGSALAPWKRLVTPPGFTQTMWRPLGLVEPSPAGKAEMRGARRGVPGVPFTDAPNLALRNTPVTVRPFVQAYWPLSTPARRTIPTPPFPAQAPIIPPQLRQKAGCMLVGSYVRTVELTGSQ